jgi:hypothetical protein
MHRTEHSLRLFLNGFTAADIAEPLLSFDDTAPRSTVRDVMDAQSIEVVGVRQSGALTGWLMREDLVSDQEWRTHGLSEASSIINCTTGLANVVHGLNHTPYLFVRSFGEVNGVICRKDLQKPPMRMWLFGLVTITELRVTRVIDEVFPDDSWRQFLSSGRLQKASELQQLRRQCGQSRRLLDCLQFADKGRIVARDPTLRQRTRFASRHEVDQFVKSLQELRNNLAHSQDISADWEIIFDLATNLHRIVMGPPASNDAPLLDNQSPEQSPETSTTAGCYAV